jgi:hypothetical protein
MFSRERSKDKTLIRAFTFELPDHRLSACLHHYITQNASIHVSSIVLVSRFSVAVTVDANLQHDANVRLLHLSHLSQVLDNRANSGVKRYSGSET